MTKEPPRALSRAYAHRFRAFMDWLDDEAELGEPPDPTTAEMVREEVFGLRLVRLTSADGKYAGYFVRPVEDEMVLGFVALSGVTFVLSERGTLDVPPDDEPAANA